MKSAPGVLESRAVHDEFRVRHSHDMPPDLKESVGRVVFRIVPLLYGGMFGALIHDLPFALGLGAVVSAGMDIAMGDYSILRSIVRPVLSRGCPVLALAARGLAGILRMVGLEVPAVLSNIRCGAA